MTVNLARRLYGGVEIVKVNIPATIELLPSIHQGGFAGYYLRLGDVNMLQGTFEDDIYPCFHANKYAANLAIAYLQSHNQCIGVMIIQ